MQLIEGRAANTKLLSLQELFGQPGHVLLHIEALEIATTMFLCLISDPE